MSLDKTPNNMKTLNINIKIATATIDELEQKDRELIEAAIGATAHSYSPYSHFCVGAALRLSNDSIVIGANQENAAFPSGLCAERTAIFAAQAQTPEYAPTTLAIAARNTNGLMPEPIVPCGSCRQVMLEMEDRYKRNLRILLYGTEEIYIINSVKDILPLTFTGDSMK